MLGRLLLLGFAVLAILGALLASGRLVGEGGLQMALGLTVFVTGAIGVVNVMFFTRLKATLDTMAKPQGQTPSATDRED